MIPDSLTPAQADALEDLFHGYDLIGCRPRPFEIDSVLAKAGRIVEFESLSG